MKIPRRIIPQLLLVASIALLSVPTALATQSEAIEDTAQVAPTAPQTLEPPLEPDAAAGATRAAACVGCHGVDGNAPNPIWPKLAGQRPGYIAKQLSDFKSGQRSDPMMAAMAAPLSDQDIVNVAAHFAGLTIRTGAGDVSLAARGERLYREGRPADNVLACISCHGVNGEGFGVGVEGGFPALGGQNPDYLVKQLESYRSSARTNDWEGIMRFVAANLSDEDIAAVVAYLVSVPRGGSVAETDTLSTGG